MGDGGKGRCAGCGEQGPVRVIVAHTVSCKKYAELARAGKGIHPATEYVRWRGEERQAEVTARIAAKVAATDQARAATADRFRTRDILEG